MTTLFGAAPLRTRSNWGELCRMGSEVSIPSVFVVPGKRDAKQDMFEGWQAVQVHADHCGPDPVDRSRSGSGGGLPQHSILVRVSDEINLWIGYGIGDLCFGNPTVRTPSLDRMASEGQKWTSYWDIPLMRNEEILERPVDQTRLTKSYTEEAIRFIRRHKCGTFLPLSKPQHAPCPLVLLSTIPG